MMISSRSITLAESQERWKLALQEAERSGICGLALSTTGPDSLCHEIRLVCLALPGNCICIADRLALGDGIISDLAGLIENAKTALSLLCTSEKRTLAASNLFDHGRLQDILPSGTLEAQGFSI